MSLSQNGINEDVSSQNGIAEPTKTDIPKKQAGKGKIVRAKLSHYYPPLGGPNCAKFVNGKCVSNMASGLPWDKWLGKACACPSEFPFGTRFYIPALDKTYKCLDRGGKIITEASGTIWLDLLERHNQGIPYGKVIQVVIKE